MLQLTHEQAEALEGAERVMLLRRASAHLALQWPAVADRLGERLPAFVDFALMAAERHGLRIALSALRYVNLCFVWGTGFEDKPGFGWARELLTDARMHEWQTVHQVVRRSVERLATRQEGLPAPEALARADAHLTQAFAGLGLLGRLLLREGVELPLLACDLELAAIRVSDANPALEYALSASGASRVTAPAAAQPWRVGTTRTTWPANLHVLARADAPSSRLQVRTIAHSTCDPSWHPHVEFAGSQGLSEARGGDARAISWPLSVTTSSSAVAGLACAIAEETTPELSRLQITTCGLREEGVPLGAGSTLVWAYPSSQWLLEIVRQRAARLEWPSASATPSPIQNVRLERDGVSLDSSGWKNGFAAVDAEVQAGIARLGAAWERSAGVEKPTIEGRIGALSGRAALTWGWRRGEGELDTPALMRVEAALDLHAFDIDLELRGDLRLAGAHALLRLRATGESTLRTRVNRQKPTPTLSESLAGATSHIRIPFALEFDSLVTPDAAVINAAGPCTGALVGEVGLRPRASGGSGWQWFVELRTEAVSVKLTIDDPLLGQVQQDLTLLPAMPVVSWRLG